MRLTWPPGRGAVVAASVLVALLVVAGGAFLYLSFLIPVRASLQGVDRSHVRIGQKLTVAFNQSVDLSNLKVQVMPITPFSVKEDGAEKLVITPEKSWQAATHYKVKISGATNLHRTQTLSPWTATFFTQPQVALSAVAVDGQAAGDWSNVVMAPSSKLSLSFSVAMNPGSISVLQDGKALPATSLAWSKGNRQLGVQPTSPQPYQPITLALAPHAVSAVGDPLTGAAEVKLMPQALEPSNPASGIAANAKTQPPILVVIDNSGPARPQVGIQSADMVFEYITEFNVSRFTAVYFNQPPANVGNVRSCRMINMYLGFAFDGYTMCSGASAGTLSYLYHPGLPGILADFDQGGHYYRSSNRVPPYNLYTTGANSVRVRAKGGLGAAPYKVDPAHPDQLLGPAAAPPAVPLDNVSWSYDGATQQYLRVDHGVPFIDASSGAQVHAKNVITITVPFHPAGWPEDSDGGGPSIWYNMLGSGPAQIWSDGHLLQATFHMGKAGEPFYSNSQPIWFTDAQNHVIQLNSGLTWIHVLGAGQSS